MAGRSLHPEEAPRLTRFAPLFASLFASLFVMVLAAFVLVGCRSREPVDIGALVPADAEIAVLLPPLETLRTPLLRFADGMEGAQGLVEWLDERYGVDLNAEDGLEEIGVHARSGAAVFLRKDVVYIVAGVDDEDRLLASLASRLKIFGYGDAEKVAGAPPVSVVTARGDGSGVLPAAFAVLDRRAVLAVRLAGDGTGADTAAKTSESAPVEEVRALLRDGIDARLDADARFRAVTEGDGLAVRGSVDLRKTLLTRARVNEMLAPLGMLSSVVRPIVNGFDRAGLRLVVEGRRLELRTRLGRAEGASSLPVAWTAGSAKDDGFAALLPSSTSLLLRLNLDARKLDDIPSFLRDRFLGVRLFGGWQPLLSEIQLSRDLLPLLTGDVAVAVLGLSDAATAASVRRALHKPAQLTSELHLALLAELRDRAAFVRAVETWLRSAKARGVKTSVTQVGEGDVRGWRLMGGRVHDLGVALIGRVAVLTVGRGELERVLAAATGRAPNLVARARTALDKAAVRGESGVVTTHISFDRVARQLQCKGFPPYILKVITSPDAIAGRVELSEEAATITLEVSQ